MNNSKVKTDNLTNNHFGKVLFTIFFLIILWLPLFQQATGLFNYSKLNEKRRKAEFPVFSWEDISRGKYFAQINTYYSDNFGFRDLLIQTNNTFNLKSFDKLVSDDLILGKNGWLYYYITVNDYQKKSMHEKDIERVVNKLESFSDDLAKHDITFFFIISPNKSTLYPEYMSDSIKKPKDGAQSNYELIDSKLKDDKKINYIDLRPLLRNKKEQYQVYPNNDSHWTYMGAYLVANEIMQQIYDDQGITFSPSSIDFEKYKLFDKVSGGGGGDLQKLLGVFEAQDIQEASKKLPDPIFPDNYNKLPRTLWYQTSFSDKLKKFENPYFEDIKYFHFQREPMKNTLNSNIEGRKIVVFELVERWLPSLIEYEFPKVVDD